MIDFFHLTSSCSTAVKAALSLTGEEHKTIAVDLKSKTKDFLKANPLGKVPALIEGDHAVSEGGAINLWLSARNPDAGLMPPLDSREGADALKWLFFAYATIHPIWIRIFYPNRFANDDAASSVKEMAISDLFSNYELINSQLNKHQFVAGEELSLADLYLAATIHWEKMLDEKLTEKYPNLALHRDRVINIPAIKQAFVGEFGYEDAT